MLIHSKELLMSGGKKQPQFFVHTSTSQSGYICVTVGEPKVGDYCFVAFSTYHNYHKTSSFTYTGTLGVSGSQVRVFRFSHDNLWASFMKEIEVSGFKFYVYGANGNDFSWYFPIVSPKQENGDNGLILASGLNTDIPKVLSVADTSFSTQFTPFGDTITFSISNTPVTDYIYRA